jgi:acyl-CoA synthetase
VAVASLERTLSYAELLVQVKRLAPHFNALGIVAGDLIAYSLPNHDERAVK